MAGKLPAMSDAQKVIGACVRALREQKRLSQEALALKAGISYQYLSGVETGKENFSIQVLESLSKSLDLPLRALVAAAYDLDTGAQPPRLEPRYFRSQTPLPEPLTVSHIETAANLTQGIFHRLNKNMRLEADQNLQSLIQGNNFSGLVSNIFSNALDRCSPYKHNHAQRYPDLIYRQSDIDSGIGLEVKATINIGKGGESHNGHGGWHLIACYHFLKNGDVQFLHIMVANLNGHRHTEADWRYLGSKVNVETGSQRTETYSTTLAGTTKLRDGSIYLDTSQINYWRWRQARNGDIPPWSIFLDNKI